MAAIGFADDASHLLGAGIKEWWMKYGANAAHYNLGPLVDGKVDIKPLTSNDGQGRPYQHGYDVQIGATMLYTPVAVIKDLDAFGAADMHHYILGLNGKTFEGTMGVSWKLNIDSARAKPRTIDIVADEYLLVDGSTADFADLLTATVVTATEYGNASQDDEFYASLNVWGTALTYPSTGRTLASGATAYKVKAASADTYESVGKIRNFKLLAESLGTRDELGRTYNTAIRVSVDFDALQTNDEWAFIKNALQPYHQLTFPDGVTFTPGLSLGPTWNPQNIGNAGEFQITKFHSEGVIQKADWAALWA